MSDHSAVPGLSDRTVAVTGGASGIGRATALLAERSGADVVVGDVDARRLAEFDVLVAEQGLRIRTVRLDLADPASVETFVAVAAEGGGLRGVVNAAGIAEIRPALDMPLDFWTNVLDINLTGAFLVSQAAARAMVAGGVGGSILNVSSAAALSGSRGQAPYTASKGGMIGMSKALAQEWGCYGIRVNCVSPGAVDTPLYRAQTARNDVIDKLPLPRIGQPEDLARAIAFFLSDQSDWITGQNLNVNGGALMY